ncbi:hypothetical protein [Nocardia sp. NPDC020380]|uniref:hypothetical protein n=1 Tax=Nocardia sp. NPDC020380 TaxID=3364309 RepID=UPI00379FA093
MRTLTVEIGNIRAGIGYDLEHDPLHALRSLGALRYMWATVGVVPEGIRLLRQALAACPEAPAVDRARGRVALALTSTHMGAATEALEHAEAVLALLDDTDPAHDDLLLEAHLRRCNALADLNDVAALRVAATAFADACTGRDAPEYALWGLGIVRFQEGDMAAAIEIHTRAHNLSVEREFIAGAGITDLMLAWCLLADPKREMPAVRQALDLLVRAVGYFEQQPNYSDQLAALLAGVFALAELGRRDIAEPLYAAVRAHAARLGTDPRRYLGFAGPDLARRLDDHVGAVPEPEQVLPWDTMIAFFTDTVTILPAAQ